MRSELVKRSAILASEFAWDFAYSAIRSDEDDDHGTKCLRRDSALEPTASL